MNPVIIQRVVYWVVWSAVPSRLNKHLIVVETPIYCEGFEKFERSGTIDPRYQMFSSQIDASILDVERQLGSINVSAPTNPRDLLKVVSQPVNMTNDLNDFLLPLQPNFFISDGNIDVTTSTGQVTAYPVLMTLGCHIPETSSESTALFDFGDLTAYANYEPGEMLPLQIGGYVVGVIYDTGNKLADAEVNEQYVDTNFMDRGYQTINLAPLSLFRTNGESAVTTPVTDVVASYTIAESTTPNTGCCEDYVTDTTLSLVAKELRIMNVFNLIDTYNCNPALTTQAKLWYLGSQHATEYDSSLRELLTILSQGKNAVSAVVNEELNKEKEKGQGTMTK